VGRKGWGSFGSGAFMTRRRNRRQRNKEPAKWSPTMEQSGRTLEGRQVLCLTADEGHVWMHYFDALPPVVRRRMAQSPFNICPACMDIEARKVAARRRPTVNTYLGVIAAIERLLGEEGNNRED
jgi:hypothetical protein